MLLFSGGRQVCFRLIKERTPLLNGQLSSRTGAKYSTEKVFTDLKRILNKHTRGTKSTNPFISRSESSLENVALDASSYKLKRPEICIAPNSVEQVQQCVRYCYQHDVPMVPVGARTGLEGGIHAMHGGVSIDMSQANDIIQLNSGDLDCHVQAGISWRELNERIKSDGLWFPVDPGASASIGGMSSTSASGTNAIKYGTMRENVLGLEVVISHGNVINTAGRESRSKKTSAGLNLTNLYVGSEGTLGIITSARLRLQALPAHIAIATVAFPTVKLATDSVVDIIRCGIPVARCEFLDQPGVNACYLDTKLANLDPRGPMLFVELQALTQQGIEDQIELIKDIFDSHQATKFNWSSKQEERTQLWKARHNVHWSILKTKPGHLSVDTDVCVPVTKFPEMVLRTHELIREYGMDAPLMGHAGDGNFHSVILYDPNKAGDFEKAKELAGLMGKEAIRLEGTVTGEHGIGRGKIDLMEEQYDEATLNIMSSIKKALDPKNLFNPGKVFKPERLASVH